MNLSSDREDALKFVRIDSINYLEPQHAGMCVLAGSHGGLYCAYKALEIGAAALILNDAGVGRDEAGIASLRHGDEASLPVATVSHLSARIGDAADMYARGRLSHVNRAAAALDVKVGMGCADALTLMMRAKGRPGPATTVAEHRHEIPLCGQTVVCIDSASLIQPKDGGGIVITGSHGGLIGGRADKAMNVRVRLAVFNDAGVGADSAGLGRLGPLDALSIAAATVSHRSARIGDALSTFEDGILSHVNDCAAAAGFRVGVPLRDALTAWLKDQASVGRAS